MADCWDFVIENEDRLRAFVEVACKGQYHLYDDLWASCVMDRVQGIFATYDVNHESGASLSTHMFASIRLYIYKFMAKQAQGRVKGGKFQGQLSTDYDEVATESEIEHELETRELVQYVLTRLPEYDARLLRMYHWDEMTFQEMADELGFNAKGSARLHYRSALKRPFTDQSHRKQYPLYFIIRRFIEYFTQI